MKVTLLGTGGPGADLCRNECCTLVTIAKEQVLIDAGRGALVQLRRAGLVPELVDLVLLTHHHLDHLTELASLIRLRPARAAPLRIIGPHGTSAIVDQLLRGPLAKSFSADDALARWRGTDVPGLRVEAEDITGGSTCEFDHWTLRAADVEHGQQLLGIEGWWHCLGYRIEAEGKSVVISGDSTYTPGLVELARDADVLVQACPWAESEVESARDREEAEGFFASGAIAGRIAAEAHAGQLILTHFGVETRTAEMENDVRQHYDGPVVTGTDLLEIAV